MAEVKLCCTCNGRTSGAHICKVCEKPCHAIEPCSVSDGNKGYGAKVICSDCFICVDDEVEGIEKNKENNNCDNKQKLKSRKRRSFTIKEKIDILEFARNTSIHKASSHFKIDRSTIQNWKKQEKSLENTKERTTRKRTIGGGRKLTDEDFDNELKKWIDDLRGKKLRVTRSMISFEAQRISVNYPSLDNFRVSTGWVNHFLKRHNLAMRRPTTVAQRAPVEFKETIVKFILHIQHVWKKHNSSSTGIKLRPFVLIPRKRPIPEIEKKFKNKLILAWFIARWGYS
ncbi:HTH CENPB-type domain-containing protein [Meloidogyne graminicola]|uniref:HTH CENPB-type domain-containing protein n=1 Tax=Meloidogyne graminicola TaxID=189291 RepID=A0A8S9ZSI7_9BILA|nr:HTH CENPB-type domain-containing protein [Meloidogyne graminicola]